MGDADEPGPREHCILPGSAEPSRGLISCGPTWGCSGQRTADEKHCAASAESFWLLGGQGRPLPERAHRRGRGAALAVSEPWGWLRCLHCDTGLSIPGPGSCPSALRPAAQLPAPHPSWPGNGQGGEAACAAARTGTWLPPQTQPVSPARARAVVLLAARG